MSEQDCPMWLDGVMSIALALAYYGLARLLAYLGGLPVDVMLTLAIVAVAFRGARYARRLERAR